MGGRGFVPNPAGELTALPRLPSWWGGVAATSPRILPRCLIDRFLIIARKSGHTLGDRGQSTTNFPLRYTGYRVKCGPSIAPAYTESKISPPPFVPFPTGVVCPKSN